MAVDPAFREDVNLGYERSRTRFADGGPLHLDDSYRVAHLPLIRPGHPLAIARTAGRPHVNGKHATAWSVVLPIDPDALGHSPAMRALEQELRESPFAQKIAWDLLPRRRDRLHATVCGGLGDGPPPVIDDTALRSLGEIGAIEIELRGLFSGDVNIGRLYLRVYPESRSGTDPLQLVQVALGRPVTDLWLVGLYNLTDNLTAAEADALRTVITKWWDVCVLRFTARSLWLLGARDDLVLDADPPFDLALTNRSSGR
jgi:hypothetical protein